MSKRCHALQVECISQEDAEGPSKGSPLCQPFFVNRRCSVNDADKLFDLIKIDEAIIKGCQTFAICRELNCRMGMRPFRRNTRDTSDQFVDSASSAGTGIARV